MRPFNRPSRLALHGASLLVIAVIGASCGEDSPVDSGGGNPPTIYSNMSFDRLGVALAPGATSTINVTPLAGSLEPFTVASSNEAVATASVAAKFAADKSSLAAGTVTVVGVSHGMATITVTATSGDKREFPVTVYDPMVLDTGEMLIRFTDQFGLHYWDQGSGADNDGDFYMPAAPEGYYPLGAIGFAGYQYPSVHSAAIVAKDKGTNASNPPLAAPIDYELLWHNGVPIFGWRPDGTMTGSFWRPIPPDGYVAMGVVVHNWEPGPDLTANDPANQKPPLDAVMCVRKDLTTPAMVDSFVWNDNGNGLKDRWFNAYQLRCPKTYSSYEKLILAPNTFVGHSNRLNESPDPVEHVLKVDPQVLIDAEYYSTLWRPTLTSLAEPDEETQPLRTRAILVPFTAFADNLHGVNWKVANSPFYVLERRYYWDKECFTSGESDCAIDYTSGCTTSTEHTRWQQESVEASMEAGFELKGIGGKVKSTITKTLGFAKSTGVSEFQEKTVHSSVPAPGKDAVCAVWKAANRFHLFRHDGMTVEEVILPWTIYEDSFHSYMYP